jgi:cobalamin synthase
VATVFAAGVVGALFSVAGVFVLAVSGGVALLVGRYALSRIGGCTGDVYGAGGELAFAAALATIMGLTR